MRLTRYQRRHLDAMVCLRGKAPGVWSIATYRPLSWLPILAICGVSVCFCLFVDPYWGMFLVGMTVGAALRIFANARFSAMAWPVTEAVTDWDKVDALRRSDEGGPPALGAAGPAPGSSPRVTS
ncbi:MAG TPA: hypothetical protein VG734_21315 [Lacunisphaera sp.]|nr:hypothetical protein [Lacunisphaera sp.]